MGKFYISEKERELLDALAVAGSLTDACRQLEIKKSAGGERLRRVKDRYLQAKEFVAEMDEYRRKLPARFL